jgi:hypothetical protein
MSKVSNFAAATEQLAELAAGARQARFKARDPTVA